MSAVEFTDILCDFFEVAIHNILYTRKLYPEAIFTPRKKYGVTVYQSEHPLVNEYITQALKAAQVHAQNKQLNQVLLNIKTDKVIVEKYVFDVIQFESKTSDSDPLFIELEQSSRVFCLKLANSMHDCKPLSSNSEFEIILHTTEFSAVAFNEEQGNKEFPWIPVNQTVFNSQGITPIHSINTDKLVLQIYFEQNYT